MRGLFFQVQNTGPNVDELRDEVKEGTRAQAATSRDDSRTFIPTDDREEANQHAQGGRAQPHPAQDAGQVMQARRLFLNIQQPGGRGRWRHKGCGLGQVLGDRKKQVMTVRANQRVKANLFIRHHRALALRAVEFDVAHSIIWC